MCIAWVLIPRDGRPVRLPGPPPKSAQMGPQAQIHGAHPAHPLRPPFAHPLQAPASFSKKLEPELLLLAGAPNRCVVVKTTLFIVISMMYIAWVLSHCKINAIHCNINDICIVCVLIHCKNNAIHCNINDIYIYIYCMGANSL
jgi:hypothetical protein